VNGEALAHWRLLRQKKKIYIKPLDYKPFLIDEQIFILALLKVGSMMERLVCGTNLRTQRLVKIGAKYYMHVLNSSIRATK